MSADRSPHSVRYADAIETLRQWDHLGTANYLYYEQAVDAFQSLVEQLQSAERERDHWKQEAEGLASEQRIAEQLQEQLQSAETTLAHAEAFIEHQDMSYRWAEWCEGRDPIPASRSS